jgi:pyruvate ferredoxin oxidoreductase beta subunit
LMSALRELTTEELLAPGHRMCAGCPVPTLVRMTLKALRGPAVIVNATGCLEVSTTIYPYTAWLLPWVHTAFENTAAVASGIEAGFKALTKKGRWDRKVDVIAFGGDGGTFDIGLQALSGALERGHDFLYICYDNEAYMNTGIQRSGATTFGAATTTSPSGKRIPGKREWKKDLIAIALAHDIPYAATASVAFWKDCIAKVRKGIEVEGPAVIHAITPCPRGWRHEPSESIKVARLAVQTRFFPLYEVENGKYRITLPVPNPLPVEEFLKTQGRFRHLFKPENKWMIEAIQGWVDKNYERLVKLSQL